jgi:putative membrane protein
VGNKYLYEPFRIYKGRNEQGANRNKNKTRGTEQKCREKMIIGLSFAKCPSIITLKSYHMKQRSIWIVSISACLAACGGNTNTTTTNNDSVKMSNDTTVHTTTMDTGTMVNKMQAVDNNTADFVKNAASGGMMEVQLGQLAQKNAKSQRVKNFGNMMVTDHSKANDELKSLASSKNISVPAAMKEDEQKDYNELSKKTGADFDKAYMTMMVNDHKKDISEFKNASQGLKDSDIKNFASKTLPVLQKHLDSAQAIHGKL